MGGRALEDLDDTADGQLEIKEFVQFYEFSRVKEGHEWFMEHGERWLRGEMRLPEHLMDPPDEGVDDRDISSFYWHMQSKKGKKWFAENGEKWMNGEVNLPAPFMAVRPMETYVPPSFKQKMMTEG